MDGEVLCDTNTTRRAIDRMYDLLKCPLCTTLMSSPIQQRPNGHTICFTCKIQLKSCCPQCGADMGSIRCLILEKLAASLKGEIPNYDCPYSGSECSVTGNIPELVTHLKDDHNVDMHDGYNFGQDYTQQQSHYQAENATWMLQVINCYGRQFCLYFEPFLLSMTPCYIAFIQFMGEDTEANKFSYSLEICASDRSLTWEGVPRSIRDTHQKVRDSLDGLVIPQNLAELFSNGNEQEIKLRIKARIWRELANYSQKFGVEETFVVRPGHGFVQKPLPDTKRLEKVAESLVLPYDCCYPNSECLLRGNIPDLVEHLKDDHNVRMHYGSTFNHRYVKSNLHEVENIAWILSVFNCYGVQFCLHFEAFHLGLAPFYILFLRFMGEVTEAKKFKYSLEIDGGNGRRLIWQGVPRSIRESHENVRCRLDGMVIPRNLSYLLSGGNEQVFTFKVKGSIWKEE